MPLFRDCPGCRPSRNCRVTQVPRSSCCSPAQFRKRLAVPWRNAHRGRKKGVEVEREFVAEDPIGRLQGWGGGFECHSKKRYSVFSCSVSNSNSHVQMGFLQKGQISYFSRDARAFARMLSASPTPLSRKAFDAWQIQAKISATSNP